MREYSAANLVTKTMIDEPIFSEIPDIYLINN